MPKCDGANTQLCLTPLEIGKDLDVDLPRTTLPLMWSWKRWMRLINFPGPCFQYQRPYLDQRRWSRGQCSALCISLGSVWQQRSCQWCCDLAGSHTGFQEELFLIHVAQSAVRGYEQRSFLWLQAVRCLCSGWSPLCLLSWRWLQNLHMLASLHSLGIVTDSHAFTTMAWTRRQSWGPPYLKISPGNPPGPVAFPFFIVLIAVSTSFRDGVRFSESMIECWSI